MEAITLDRQILDSIRTLPIQQQHEVLNFAEFLHQKAARKPPRRSLKGLCADLKIITEAASWWSSSKTELYQLAAKLSQSTWCPQQKLFSW